MSQNPIVLPLPFGISADTGLPLESFSEATLPDRPPPELIPLEYLRNKAHSAQAHLGTMGDVDPNDLTQAGWGAIFGHGVETSIREALDPLLHHRRRQVLDDRLFKTFTCFPGETAEAWLDRQGVRMDVVDPQLGVPYYLLIVAPPTEIPFEFQYSLDLNFGVGRLWFDTAEEFRQYADSVIRYETMPAPPTARQATVFATAHDPATQLFLSQVAQPLAEAKLGQRQKFSLQPVLGATATKDALHGIYRQAPALLFTGTHGASYPPHDPRQAPAQGAILCQDWPGRGALPAEHLFAAVDLPTHAHVHGMIQVLFACYGGGYPQYDNFQRHRESPREIAAEPRLARLPQALLAHPNGGALAVLAHVDRAWSFSFQSDQASPQTQGFRDVMGRILRGDRLGEATDSFNQRWAALSTELADALQLVALGRKADPYALINRWLSRDDARNYIVLGDPAVRLRVWDMA